jgi:hypothetical protein
VNAPPSLLVSLQGLLARTYRMRAVEALDLGRFVIGDAGYRRFYGGEHTAAAAADGSGARTLIREADGGVRASMYLPDALVQRLERHPPQHGVSERNVDAFATLVEELDHLLYVADRAAGARTLTLFELELHANVSKHLVLTRFLAGGRGRLTEAERVWLRFHLFEKFRYADEDGAVRARYRQAARWGVRFLDALAERDATYRLAALRRFHDASAGAKLRLISSLAEPG